VEGDEVKSPKPPPPRALTAQAAGVKVATAFIGAKPKTFTTTKAKKEFTRVRRLILGSEVKPRKAKTLRSRALRPLVAQALKGLGPVDREFKTLVEAYCEIAINGCLTFARKQHDYGPQNIGQGGPLGVLIRLNDKVQRMLNLAGKTAKNESKVDTADDAHVYGAILRLLLAGKWPGATRAKALQV
jgi:hypothetical protein